ncbi:unnamed protein product [Triticum turgidum subsp. durum]|uniref:RNA helicase n=1 Tax=Triticum turgidum subsp. durum TaxID=4567 RepID=A0A9R0TJF9_TRITD|nr:unnamed protein product [Triticum turgidum subsp. durum]
MAFCCPPASSRVYGSESNKVLDDRARDSRLVALLDKYHRAQSNRVLVFVLYKKEAGRVEAMLNKRGWKAVSVHGDKAQHDRTKALSLFKEGKCPLMIATDVASRGLDIPDVEVVINYSFPLTTEDYVHRIGRTGRAGKKGVAHTFFTQADKGLAGELVNVLREADQVVPPALTKFGTHVKKKESKIYGSHFKEITADAPKSTKITFDDLLILMKANVQNANMLRRVVDVYCESSGQCLSTPKSSIFFNPNTSVHVREDGWTRVNVFSILLIEFVRELKAGKKSKSRKTVTPRGATMLPYTGQWDENLIRTVFWPVDVHRILQIPLRVQVMEDFVSWDYNPSGEFTVRLQII